MAPNTPVTMSKAETTLGQNVSSAALISALTAYSVALGMSYLWGYWSPFNINILDYMTVADILTATAWPLISLLTSIGVGILIGGIDAGSGKTNDSNKIGSAIVWYWAKFKVLHFAMLLLIWILDVPNKWLLLGLLGGIPLSVYIMLLPVIDRIPVSRTVKLMVVFFFVVVPPSAISTGRSNAELLMSGEKYLAVFSEVVGYPIAADVKPEKRLRLIGHRGEMLFMWEPATKRTVIGKFSSDHPLVLERVNLQSEGSSWSELKADFGRFYHWLLG